MIQKSIKEGFGLAVAEALWKETPVVAGNAGGIPLQMGGRLSDYLVDTIWIMFLDQRAPPTGYGFD